MNSTCYHCGDEQADHLSYDCPHVNAKVGTSGSAQRRRTETGAFIATSCTQASASTSTYTNEVGKLRRHTREPPNTCLLTKYITTPTPTLRPHKDARDTRPTYMANHPPPLPNGGNAPADPQRHVHTDRVAMIHNQRTDTQLNNANTNPPNNQE